ncbi:Phosphoribosylaminoimidazole-succinocarboxamide synthase [Aequoribacter fuscus]|jgi:phosphoribosylaminoimidazole-succinocarboxamide synthase|uniref:Phosphoribosylaminoimidazole-succinocarboxamide synthase n=1 Tax=Aequoribacter fuscus TaxID=2518989 RepID=F3L3W5_9GAMM|nr:phosphoribosylaminoimidazolesuccinocarboxamide synthase [Aequoribacter fuscus]EGG29014.1 Phosphoribosylaminoimidazole-succinocarboxamide synthase [Aequoribacter fuscus]QHJ88164.1 phosphoribosylaminoimidazolesuccinocarboxamide synthase [Aequoribacter fuscus]
MASTPQVLAVADTLPIKTEQAVHSGKVRSVYWLTQADSERLIKTHGYDVAPDAPLAIMVISDRISAFECLWKGQGGMAGVPGKGAALNAISQHWFEQFKQAGLADSHIVDVPHPLVWIVQKAQPVMVEAIARQYITGSMWRAYSKGERVFCGIELPEGLQRDQRLPELLITPSTKGIMRGIPGVPEADDVNVTRQQLIDNWQAFRFQSVADVDRYETLLREGFALIDQRLQALDQIFVDTKFEFGYVKGADGNQRLIYMDEVGTPDSSRIWEGDAYRQGQVVERSKEEFRQLLLNTVPDPDVLLDKSRMDERFALAAELELPTEVLLQVSATYTGVAERITGREIQMSDDPRSEIIEILASRYDLIKS